MWVTADEQWQQNGEAEVKGRHLCSNIKEGQCIKEQGKEQEIVGYNYKVKN